jgi:uncharacterized membrane protein YccC
MDIPLIWSLVSLGATLIGIGAVWSKLSTRVDELCRRLADNEDEESKNRTKMDQKVAATEARLREERNERMTQLVERIQGVVTSCEHCRRERMDVERSATATMSRIFDTLATMGGDLAFIKGWVEGQKSSQSARQHDDDHR